MVKITDKQLDLALRMASQYCYEDDIAMMRAVNPNNYPITKNTQKKVERAIKKSERKKRWDELGIEIPTTFRKIAAIMLVIGTLLFTGMMTIQPVRATMIDVIIRWYNQYIGILFITEEQMPLEIEEVILQKDIGEGWKITQLMKVPGQVEYMITSSEGEQFRLSQLVIEGEEQWIDNEEMSSWPVEITNNQNGVIYIYSDRTTLIWKTEYAYILRGGKSSEEKLLQIARAILTP